VTRSEQNQVPPWDWRAVFKDMVIWLESSMDPVDPDLVKRFREEPKHLHLEVSSDTPLGNPDQIERTVDLAVLNALWIEWFQFSSLESVARRLLGLESRFPPLHITECYCPHSTSTASHPPSCHFDRRAWHAACLRTAKMVLSELHNLDFRGNFKGELFTGLNKKIKSLLDSTPSQCYPFEPELLPVYEVLFQFVERLGNILARPNELETSETEWLKWLETCPDGYATSAEALKRQILALCPRRSKSSEERQARARLTF
ncbi:hypothetical protein V5O48_017413, partial [Marasmius crinis-equi]